MHNIASHATVKGMALLCVVVSSALAVASAVSLTPKDHALLSSKAENRSTDLISKKVGTAEAANRSTDLISKKVGTGGVFSDDYFKDETVVSVEFTAVDEAEGSSPVLYPVRLKATTSDRSTCDVKLNFRYSNFETLSGDIPACDWVRSRDFPAKGWGFMADDVVGRRASWNKLLVECKFGEAQPLVDVVGFLDLAESGEKGDCTRAGGGGGGAGGSAVEGAFAARMQAYLTHLQIADDKWTMTEFQGAKEGHMQTVPELTDEDAYQKLQLDFMNNMEKVQQSINERCPRCQNSEGAPFKLTQTPSAFGELIETAESFKGDFLHLLADIMQDVQGQGIEVEQSPPTTDLTHMVKGLPSIITKAYGAKFPALIEALVEADLSPALGTMGPCMGYFRQRLTSSGGSAGLSSTVAARIDASLKSKWSELCEFANKAKGASWDAMHDQPVERSYNKPACDMYDKLGMPKMQKSLATRLKSVLQHLKFAETEAGMLEAGEILDRSCDEVVEQCGLAPETQCRAAVKALKREMIKLVKAVKDPIRATLLPNSVTEIGPVAEAVISQLELRNLDFIMENKWETPAKSGYADVKFIVQMSNAEHTILAELQLNTKSYLDAKDVGHTIYEWWRAGPKTKVTNDQFRRTSPLIYGTILHEMMAG